MKHARLQKNDAALLTKLNKLVCDSKNKSGLRRTLSYVAAIYDCGEGNIIEKDLKQYFLGMDDFQQKIEAEFNLSDEVRVLKPQ